MWDCSLDFAGSGWGQLECGSVGWMELAQDRDRWDLDCWLKQDGSGYGQVACTCECGNEI
jgi:hypothetical protein